ncbi:cbb3-type cytochrome oxidase assembly protein CcoS [Chelativorans alearense]|uniref:cbb3-type cytochrome oxidase assembly protein CcoS n=1 Tax=Chelativorans alearense TaxID=2681495 RepID=UPI0013D694F1|nr:cbb3-type cytochrome oxidase assembly protein CcoS [Chelativorans alearense]
MTNLAFLIPVALFLGALGLGTFLWTLRSGQYDDLDGAAERVLFDAPEGDQPETGQRHVG